MKIISLITFLVLNCAFAGAQGTMSLNGTWDFALQKESESSPTKLESKIEVPSCWAVLGWEEPIYRGFRPGLASTGHYRRSFEMPQLWAGRRVLLHFDGVWACATPTLNGYNLGAHDSGYTSFAYDVTKFLKDGENILEVKVDQRSRYSSFDTNDDWTLGGIYRDVWLESMPLHRWLEKPTVITTFDKKFRNADLCVKFVLADDHKSKVAGNFPSFSEECKIVYSVFAEDGSLVKLDGVDGPVTEIVSGQDATDKEIVKHFAISRPQQWNAESPRLYTLKVDLYEGEALVHSRSVRFGFRQIDIDGDGVFKVNGTAVKLRGVNRHDEHPDVGRATRREHWLEDLQMMKDNNINYIRICHYTPAPGFIDLCDSLGMYVSNEVSLGGGDAHFRDPSYAEGVLLRSYETVIRDINAPSIIFWTIGNEDPFTPIHLAARNFVRSLDQTRPAAMPWRAEGWLSEEFEILAPHYWQPAEYDSLATTSKRPIISTEYTHAYGTHATGGLEARWKAITSHPNGTGAAVWMWQDQGIRTPILPEKPSSMSDDPYLRLSGEGWDGIVDSDRNVDSRDLQEVKAVYAQVFPTVNSVKARRRIKIPIRNDYDFTNLKGHRIYWEQYADTVCVCKGEVELHAAPHTTKPLKIKIASASGEYANYITLRFTRLDGSEITHRSIELKTQNEYKPASLQGVVEPMYLINNIRPIIWHKLDNTESFMYSSADRKIANSVDFDDYKIEQLSASEKIENGVDIILAKNRYIIDENNSFTGDFEFRISENSIKLSYTIVPDIQLPWIPVWGMALNTDGRARAIKYIGLGPEDAYPNKQSAPTFGIWRYEGGIKAARSILYERWDGIIRIDCDGYLETNPYKPGEILIIKEVVSRPEKGRKAVAPFPLNRCEQDAPFTGEITITLK